VSPDQSVYCQCGFDLVSDVRSELSRERVGWRASARKLLWTGVAVAGLGAVLTVATFLTAEERGGRFYIFTGLFVVGVGMLWRGYVRLGEVADAEAADQTSRPSSG
jgi:hypothetical protein